MGKARVGLAGRENTSGDHSVCKLEMGSKSQRSQNDSASPKGQFRESGGAWACWGRVEQQLKAILDTKGGREVLAGAETRVRAAGEGCLGVSRKLHGWMCVEEWG